MTTSGDPNEPRPGQDPREGRPEEEEPGRPAPDWWREGEPPEEGEERPGQGEEPIAPVPPVVPPPDVPPTHEPRPGGEPSHPDLPTSPETPPPVGGDAEATQAYPIPGATPPYPGWGGAPGEGEPPARPTPSRYEGEQPSFTPPGEGAPQREGALSDETPPEGITPPVGGPPRGGPPPGAGVPGGPPPGQGVPGGAAYPGGYGAPQGQEPAVPGTTPSSPYGGPPGYGPPPAGAPYGAPYQQAQPGSGLATASLVLGVASPFLVFVCFTGLITAILSIVFGCVALAKRAGKGRAIAGIVISAFSLVLFAIVAIWFWNVVQECAHLPGQLADRCFEQKFPWMSGSR
ncbi:DUF4190 domain-containing protein [Nonomuraea helvata]|uniref:DUF4190 domain-containing protein n=1 Tax=Nonomuraea helvata TaxID=37484 RepID=A0ABV5RV35_9ACTN